MSDYTKYTIEELYQALNSVDQTAHFENYQKILNEIEVRKKKVDFKNEIEDLVNDGNLVLKYISSYRNVKDDKNNFKWNNYSAFTMVTIFISFFIIAALIFFKTNEYLIPVIIIPQFLLYFIFKNIYKDKKRICPECQSNMQQIKEQFSLLNRNMIKRSIHVCHKCKVYIDTYY